MNLRRSICLLLICCLFTATSGCSFFVPSMQSLSVSSSEEDAEIFINGNFIGVGNVTDSVKRNENVAILVKKDGYYTSTRNIGKTLSAVGIVDCIGGWIIILPFVGLLAPGAWELQQTNIAICMAEKKK